MKALAVDKAKQQAQRVCLRAAEGWNVSIAAQRLVSSTVHKSLPSGT
ncbi:hypothetical protein [Paraburkholderia phytofirmans]|nr:hypothetical protein [Paraburkholderia phytofirmans]